MSYKDLHEIWNVYNTSRRHPPPPTQIVLKNVRDVLTGDGEHLQVSVYKDDPGEAKESQAMN